MARLTRPDPLAEADGKRPLRPVTVQQYRLQLVRFASEVVDSGVPIERLQSLSDLMAPDIVECGLRQMLSRSEEVSPASIAQIASRMRHFGKLTGQSIETQQNLERLAQRLAVPPQKGMTSKNRQRLRVLQNDKSMQRLLRLPDRLFAHAQKSRPHTYTDLLVMEDAVAVAILLVCPIRVKNLSAIHVEHNIQRPGDGGTYLVFQESDVKNEQLIEFVLPSAVVRMIDQLLAARSPLMCPAGTPWLFPKRDGLGSVGPGELATRIKKRVRKETGFEVNAHLFRHLAVMNWLDANPGGYEVARRLLGHSSVSRTINLYSGLEVTTAARAFANLIEDKKRGDK